MFKITVFVGLILFFLSSFSFAQGGQDSITITTYYPSPYGVYRELRLYPNTGQTSTCNSANDIGKLYYDDSDIPHQVYVCRQTETFPDTYDWERLGGGAGGLGTYVGNTTLRYNGAEVDGYAGGDAKCAAEYPGSRMCMAADFVNGRPPGTSEGGWYNTFISLMDPAYTDCNGWSASSGCGGSIWGQYCLIWMGENCLQWLGGDFPAGWSCSLRCKITCCQE